MDETDQPRADEPESDQLESDQPESDQPELDQAGSDHPEGADPPEPDEASSHQPEPAPSERPQPGPEAPRDILAAEAFAVGAPDPALHREEAHDVLAADEFPLPAAEPHAIPPGWNAAGPDIATAPGVRGGSQRVRRLALVALGAIVLLARRRRARGRRAADR